MTANRIGWRVCVALASASLACGCSPHIVTTAELRDPNAVFVRDSRGAVVLPEAGAGGEARSVSTRATDDSAEPVAVTRDTAGALWIARRDQRARALVEATGRAVIDIPEHVSPEPPPPRFDGGVLTLTSPIYTDGRRRSEVVRVDLVTPLPNVTRVTVVRERAVTGLGLVVGLILGAAGTGLIVDTATHPGLTPGQRVGGTVLCTAMAMSGVMMVGVDLYALLTPRTERVLYASPTAAP